MSLVYTTEEKNPLIDTLVRSLVAQPEKINLNVDANDEMYQFAAGHAKGHQEGLIQYFRAGLKLYDSYRQMVEWRFKSFDKVGNLLDFASGYGRATRFVLQALPPERIWASDIYADAVQFQQEQYGVNGLVSVLNPQDYKSEVKFDCIFVVSLFSHLPEATFTRWLAKLYSLLTPNGLLAFSVHDEAILPEWAVMPESGMWFYHHSESQTLDTNDYGGTWVTEGFVSRAIKEATGGQASYHRLPKGFDNYQDVYVVVPGQGQDFSGFHYDSGPQGFLEKSEISADGTKLCLSGWAAPTTPGYTIQDLQFVVNGQVLQHCTPTIDRPDIAAFFKRDDLIKSGWECEVDLPPGTNPYQAILSIKLLSTSGVVRVIHVGTIQKALDEIKKAVTTRVEESEKQLLALTGEYNKLKDWALELQADRDNLAEEYHKISAEYHRISAEYHKLAEVFRTSTSGKAVEQKTQELTAIKGELEQARATVAKLQAETADHEALLRRYQQDLRELQATKTVRISKTASSVARQLGTRLRRK